MFSPAIEQQRRTLYTQTVQQMGRRIPPAANPADSAPMLAALRWGMDEIDRTYDNTPAKVRASVACRAGCSHCCSAAVDVQAHEVFFVAEHIQLHFSAEELAGVIDRTADLRARLAVGGSAARNQPWQACALLHEDRCSVYASRPEACRAHHTSDAEACAAHAADPEVELDNVYIPALRARLFAVMLGMDEALESAGYDDRSYDFSSALHEALTNSLCRTLWLRRKAAFPDSCLSPEE
jgi:Fe-S-cluster containining protein